MRRKTKVYPMSTLDMSEQAMVGDAQGSATWDDDDLDAGRRSAFVGARAEQGSRHAAICTPPDVTMALCA
jgi:hypothetical protein